MDAKVLEAGDALEDVFAHFDKTFDLDTPYLYGSNSRIICAPAQIRSCKLFAQRLAYDTRMMRGS